MSITTTRFRKNPVEIEAIQFNEANKDMVYVWASHIQMNVYPAFDSDNKPVLRIPTLEGEMDCCIGDWIIVEPFPTDWRKLYPCKDVIFKKTYTEISDKPALWGQPTSSTAVDGRIINVGDILRHQWQQGDRHDYQVVFRNNRIFIEPYYMKSHRSDLLSKGVTEFNILKKYNEQ